MTQVGKNIKTYRTESQMTQQDLADKMSVTRQTISGWEQGRTEPDLASLGRLAEVLQVSVEELICGKRKSKEEIKDGWKKRLVVALIWVAISVVWFIICQKYVQWYNKKLITLDVNVIGAFLWYYLLKPLRFIFLAIAVLSLIRVNINLYIPRNWLRIVLLAAGFVFIVVFAATMVTTWFSDAGSELRRQLFWFFNDVSAYELEIIYVIPAICIYLGVVGDVRKKRGRTRGKVV